MRSRRAASAANLVPLAVVLLGACGDDAGSAGLSAAAADGRRIVNSSGCSGCHGGNGQGGIGPAFVGSFGAARELEDGSVVTVDEAYLAESITDPGAKLVAGYSQRMPDNGLDDDEVAAVIQYIRELTPGASSSVTTTTEAP